MCLKGRVLGLVSCGCGSLCFRTLIIFFEHRDKQVWKVKANYHEDADLQYLV